MSAPPVAYEPTPAAARARLEAVDPASFLYLPAACMKADEGCPALRCGAVETSAPTAGEGPIRIKVVPFPGVRIDTKVIECCLEFTLGCSARRSAKARGCA